MTFEPRPRKGYGDPRNTYEGRWRPWYSSIADWMIENPGGKADDCARKLGKHVATIRFIMNTDLFKDYFAQRREEWSRMHDQVIVSKTTSVAEKALDLMLDKMERQADKIPMNLVTEVATSALDRLGYAPRPATAVEVNVNSNNKVIMIPISAGALEEARDAIRAAEQRRTIEHRELEAEPEPPQGGEAQDTATTTESEPPHRS